MWEYLVLGVPDEIQSPHKIKDLEEWFDDVGAEGWEFTGSITTYNAAIFKRPRRGVSETLERQQKRAAMSKTVSKKKTVSAVSANEV